MKILLTVLALSISIQANAAVCSRTLTFIDGSVLSASQLNGEFNAITNCANSIDNSNISSTANITPSKLNAIIAGEGIGRDGATGVLSINVDDASINITSDTIQIKDSGVITTKINDSAVTTPKIADSNVTTPKIADSNVTTPKIADGAVTAVKKEALNYVRNILPNTGFPQPTLGIPQDFTAGGTINLTTAGRPVRVELNMSATCLYTIQFTLLRDGTVIRTGQIGGENNYMATFSIDLSTIDNPSAGVHIYKTQYQRLGGVGAGSCASTTAPGMFFAYEL